ncbi:hypothetical protein DRO49_02405 [Candidatus Bathyarchaeota archaeon]|nr:MAG: hypothetical protein DRO49_02405 [Candidatus Bathyarchaeota archaeon]
MGQKVLWLRGDLVERLREMRRQGFVMSAVVERALRSYLRERGDVVVVRRQPICVRLSDDLCEKLRGRNSSEVVERALESFFGERK